MNLFCWLTCLLFFKSFLLLLTVFCLLGIQVVHSNELINNDDGFRTLKQISMDLSGPQAIRQLQREKKELVYKLDKQRSNLQLIKMERSFDIQRKHEKEAEESYLLDLDTELDKRVAELQPIVDSLVQRRKELEEKIEMLSKEVRFLQQTTGQYSSELNQWFDYQVESLHPAAQRLLRKSRELARMTWQNLLTAVDANKILTDHVASEFDKYFHLRENSIETGVLFHLLILIPIICLFRFLFQFTQIAKSQITCKTLVIFVSCCQMAVCIMFYLFSIVSRMDPLVLIQRHYANFLGIVVMTIMLSLLVLGGCFIILYWRQRCQNILSCIFGIGSIMFHFYCCIFKPALMDDPLAAMGSIYLIYCSILYFMIMDFLPITRWDVYQNFQKWFSIFLVVIHIHPTKLYYSILENRKYLPFQFDWISRQKLLNDIRTIHWRIRNTLHSSSIQVKHLLEKLYRFVTKQSKFIINSRSFCSQQSPKLNMLITSSPNSIHTSQHALYNPTLRRENSSNSLRYLPW
ncbi:hypothetical protein GpartN1_g3835.t1 [Galdieria partita]|uniref:Uncharacterized protein n=1 Tax=Galdieria partita TaxID=83374 RepID=A0A9C7PWW8_9RHOD|nr:hypothetical protein GpartN1_g3835.t1 [Galdieria partita]